MNVHLKGVNLSVTSKTNSMPTSKPVAGRFRMSPDWENASFVEEDATVIYGDPKAKCLKRGRLCSVWWHPEKKQYKISLRIVPAESPQMPEWAFEDCMNFIRRRINDGTDKAL